ncbi:MAG: amidohydrolase family protein [Planctomycetes bacterium]|jgi:imidazolonepropionase-like amidohydrolase|nr:amidohydrolase family protein [Planctomycetota bacterium]MBT6967457.1 amidohydrolase family protein [Planctomycetota bacterium]MBT7641203.1 amidohydrolase family protein [Planctomycetota bacterium]
MKLQFLLTIGLAAAGFTADLAGQQTLAIRGETIHTMARQADGQWMEPIENGVVLIIDGKVAAVGPASAVEIPDGFRVIEAAVVTPGLIDSRSVVGLAGWLNYDHDQDQLERSSPMQPELDARDAYNVREPLIEWVRSLGVTTLHTGHAPGQLISGQTFIVKTRGDNVDQAVLKPNAMVVCTLGSSGFGSGGKSPGTRAKQMAMIRQEFIKARSYMDKIDAAQADEEKEAPARDLRNEVLVEILRGERPLMITAHGSVDIQNALRLQKELQIKVVLEGASECYDYFDELKEQQIPVIIHPTMMRASGKGQNSSMETVAKMVAAGIPVAMGSGYESYVPKTRVVLWEAAIACAYGCPFNDALGLITASAAELLGISDRVGSLEVGKDGDVALYDGDPFEYTSHCVGTIIDGVVVSEKHR